MNKLFVPYELALKLKEKGFDEPCCARYNGDELQYTNWDKHGFMGMTYKSDIPNTKVGLIKAGTPIIISAPLYQQVVDWFREKHEIYIIPFIQYEPAFGEKETIIHSYMILNLPIMREKELSYLPYVEANNYMENADVDTWYGSLNEAIEEALKLI